MALTTSQLLRPVHPAHRFDEAALLRYATAHVEGFPSPPQLESFSVTQFGHGQSNPTFCLEAVSNGTPPVVRRYVLRKKPPGVILQSAHAVEREFQVKHFSLLFLFIFWFSSISSTSCEYFMNIYIHMKLMSSWPIVEFCDHKASLFVIQIWHYCDTCFMYVIDFVQTGSQSIRRSHSCTCP